MACTRIGVNSPQLVRLGGECQVGGETCCVSFFSALFESSLSPPGQPARSADLTSLFKVKRWSGRVLAGVAVAVMLYSAADMVEFDPPPSAAAVQGP
jgi:hypothetical protein